jgi:hypothetical protein
MMPQHPLPQQQLPVGQQQQMTQGQRMPTSVATGPQMMMQANAMGMQQQQMIRVSQDGTAKHLREEGTLSMTSLSQIKFS